MRVHSFPLFLLMLPALVAAAQTEHKTQAQIDQFSGPVHSVSTQVVMAPIKHPSVGSNRGTETVLVVEDEAAVRNLVRTVLGRKGYAVLAAQDGAAALDLLEKHTGVIHVLLRSEERRVPQDHRSPW